jgi:hypothetical protein
MFFGVESINSKIVSFKILKENPKVNNVNTIEMTGSKILHSGLYFMIIAEITTPIDYTISPII